MCGFYGIAAPNVAKDFLEAATDTLAHRGPDAAGYYLDGHIGLGHRRLSIIDLAGSDQPIFNEDRSKCIVFNGEIYNYAELRSRLVALGHRFTTHGDTETILHAYEEWGESCVTHLSGMFAFAIWDAADRTLFLARDRLGIKPLFYGEYRKGFCFASEMKAMLLDEQFPRGIDEQALAGYFMLSYIPGEATIYPGIRKLLPGHTLTWRDGGYSTRKYWDLEFVPDKGKTEDFFIRGSMDLLSGAVDSHMISEVPLGAFLSGGLDSSAIVAMMSKSSARPVNTFCMGFGGDVGGYLDERMYARQVADRYATRHRDFEVLPGFEGLVETIVRAFDEPFADDSAIPSYFVCKIARENVTVALSGLGGDEAFAGYERYLGFALSGWLRQFPAVMLKGLIQPLVESLPERNNGHYTVNHMKRFVRSAALAPDDCYLGFINKIKPGMRSVFFADPEHHDRHFASCRDLMCGHFNSANVSGRGASLNRPLYCDIKTYLPEDILCVTDRMSMQHSLEVRVPFLDHKFLEFCATIPEEMKLRFMQKKYLMKKAVRSLLPKEVISHRKQGFVGPMTRWLKKDLKPFVLETLSEGNLRKHNLLNCATVRTVLDEHFSGREIHDTLIWSMVIFQTWYNLYIDRR
ncbi:MAG: asparagine synthase (glutamine-hydrolyzing) [Desulfuromonadaceae bacterium]|nr:asparagine synthase (glutamine-hydrolyzing) [Desulfuromonadaceae bacterium]MDD2848979.1 asparagine synthase (glutamine-hydrolyzing) [Desulfuromonadaceae bacterium]MDD4130328.1 asparagine synthase (glutamine-hydrolyzing) [Desulfuromonadaceae bacterium]